MVNITFVLKDVKAASETPVICYIRYSSQRVKYSTGEKILPKHWNNNKQSKKYQRANNSLIGSPEFNARLDLIENTVKNVFRKYRNENSNALPTTNMLKQLLDVEFRRAEVVKHTFLSFFGEIIEQTRSGTRLHHKTGKPITTSTLKTYVTTYKHFAQFQTVKRRTFDFADIDMNFYDDYKQYLMQSLNLSTNAVGKDFQIIKLMMSEATERGLNTNLLFRSKRFVTVRENSDSIYLSKSEIAELAGLDLSDDKRLEKVRDLFLIGCHTGLRYSDYSILKPHHIQDGFIELKQTKTGDSVTIPVHNMVKRIIEKYNGELPKAISNQKTNKFLKEAAQRLASFNEIVEITFTKGGQKHVQKFRKHELLATHTARRSFATNEYLEGTPTLTIMAITGHRTEKAFMRYIKLSSKEHAKLLQIQWSNRTPLAIAN